jgi:uncharacterized protein
MGTGIDTYIIKTASICNLDCSYCYYYHGADTSYRLRPKRMPMEVIVTSVPKIIDHCRRHGIQTIDLTLHGGEPLLQTRDDFVTMMRQFDLIDAAGITTRRKCQTNAVLLDDAWAELLTTWKVRLGVSIDGPREAHDQYRVDHAGRGSYDRAVGGLRTALAWWDRGLRTSVLSVINPAHSGGAMYRHLRSLGVAHMDFLIPEANYAHPPEGYQPLGAATPYGDFLIEVFDAWIGEDDPGVHVRLLDRILRSLLGQTIHSDDIGTADVRVAVLEADGAIEPTDNFKSCVDGMTDLGLSIFRDDFDALYHHDFFDHCLDGAQRVPMDCAGCPFVSTCGGGRTTTRFSLEGLFSRRTIYCYDLYKVYEHVQATIDRLAAQAA